MKHKKVGVVIYNIAQNRHENKTITEMKWDIS